MLGNPFGRHSADDPETKLANFVEDLTEFAIMASLFQVWGIKAGAHSSDSPQNWETGSLPVSTEWAPK